MGEWTTYGTRSLLGDVLVRVYRNGVKEQSFTTGQGGKYTVDLERGGSYVIHFQQARPHYQMLRRGYQWEFLERGYTRGFRFC